MFFEEESKDTHGNMDDYDLDFEQDESVSWDKLLDDKDSDDETLKLLSEENDNEDSVADSLLNMDDESFENFIEEQKQNILKNKEKEEQKAKAKEPVVADEPKIDVLEEIENIDAREQQEEENVLKNIDEKMQEIAQEPENPAPIPVLPDVAEESQEIEISFGNEQKEDTVNVDEFVQDDYNYSEQKPTAKKSSPLTIFALVIVLAVGIGYYVFTNVLNNEDFASNFSNIASLVGIQTNNNNDMFDPTDINLPANINTQDVGLDSEIVGLNLPTEGKKSTDKKETEEKVNLKIVETGRQTPFVPVANLNNLGFGTTPKLDIAKPFEKLGEPDPAIDRLMQVVVSGILHDGSANPSAVISVSGVDYFVQKGDKIDTFVVVEITRDTVVIKEKNNIFSATTGQRFTNIAKIDGEIELTRTGDRQIQRQYTTLDDVGINIQ